jgi:hypothetical protein
MKFATYLLQLIRVFPHRNKAEAFYEDSQLETPIPIFPKQMCEIKWHKFLFPLPCNVVALVIPFVCRGLFTLSLVSCGAIDDSTGADEASTAVVSDGPGSVPVQRWLEEISTSAPNGILGDVALLPEVRSRFLIPDQSDRNSTPLKADLATQHVLAMADFNGDGRADVLWQSDSGTAYITSLLESTARCPTVSLGLQSHTVMGTGDFNGDGKADIVWRNMSTGAVRISLIDVAGDEGPSNVVRISEWLNVGLSPIALNTKLEGIGDFDGNGRADMLWRNQTTGRSVMSFHNADGSVASWPVVSEFINPLTTTALKVGDINGDGKDDIVWRNMSTGNVVISIMNGSVPAWIGITASPISPNVRLEAVGDFDDNGKADLLWRNTFTGRSLMSYHSADGTIASWPVVSEYINPMNTSAVAVGDTDGDGKTDILWRNLTTGNSVLSKMNGSAPEWKGISFSTCSSTATSKLPHSGKTANQCNQPGSNSLVPCSSKSAMHLFSQQDGHQITINPLSYGTVGNYRLTSCVKDNVTGLIWEGKESGGIRAGSNSYTNYDSTSVPQVGSTLPIVNPTQAQIDALSNSVGYKNYVNSIALCGFTDWRIPTVDELATIVDYGKPYPGPSINTIYFPNTSWGPYWSSTPYVPWSYQAWAVGFLDGHIHSNFRTVAYFTGIPSGYYVRLVRSTP